MIDYQAYCAGFAYATDPKQCTMPLYTVEYFVQGMQAATESGRLDRLLHPKDYGDDRRKRR
jgi:hypothetical protein